MGISFTDEGFMTQHCASYFGHDKCSFEKRLTVHHGEFATVLAEFAKKTEDDRDAAGRPKDGGFVITHRSGVIQAAAVKFVNLTEASVTLPNTGTRHEAALRVAWWLGAACGMGVVLVRSEA